MDIILCTRYVWYDTFCSHSLFLLPSFRKQETDLSIYHHNYSSASRHFGRLSCNLGGADTHPQTITKNMRQSLQLLQNTARITLFTRSNCRLCDSAKLVLRKVAEKRSFDLHEINVMDSNQKKWKDLYEYDTPVVSSPRGKIFCSY